MKQAIHGIIRAKFNATVLPIVEWLIAQRVPLEGILYLMSTVDLTKEIPEVTNVTFAQRFTEKVDL